MQNPSASTGATGAWPYLLLLLPPLFWGGNIVLARGVYEIIPPVTLSFWRWIIALCFLLPFTWKQVRRDRQVIYSGWKVLCLLSLCGIASFNTLLYTAMHTTTAINGALMQSVMPAVIILLSFLFFRERISRRQGLGVLICMLGAVFIVMRGDWQRVGSLAFVEGDLLMMLAVILYAAYSSLLRKSPRLHALSFVTVTFAMGAAMLLPLFIWETATTPALIITPGVLTSILYVAVFPSILAYLCWNYGIKKIGANRAGLYINLIPLFASLMAVFFLEERFANYHLQGILLIVLGIALFNLHLRKPKIRS